MSPVPTTLLSALEAAALQSGVDARAFRQRLQTLASSAPEPERALRNLQRLLDAGFSSSLVRDFATHPNLLGVCFELVGQSQYLADIIVRDPELLRWLTASDVLSKARTQAELEAEARHTMGLFERVERRYDALRRFHRREMLRIGAREILQEADVETITGELSALADAATRCVTDQAHADLNARLGADLPNRMAVLALGKLGGGELNFSSDIDLMFVYDADGELPQTAGRLHTWHEYYARLGEAVVRGLAEFTSEGHLYRVDMRLRPDGRSGPLAMSRGAMMTYYESRGAAWERQMLLKARVIAGAFDVGERFLKDLQPFIFPRTTSHAPWVEIAKMKETIERDADVAGNIKLGIGGIRDIEFLAQGLQLLFAGQDASLRTGHTMRALERLVASGHIPAGDGERLREAYAFFRTLEHRLQLLHGRQTHELPETDEERAVLGRKLGMKDAAAFIHAVKTRREFVRSQFEAFTKHPSTTGAGPDVALQVAIDSTDWTEPVRSLAMDRLRALAAGDASRRLLEAALRNPRHRHWILRAALLAPRIIERLQSEPLLLESLIGNADILLRRADPAWDELLTADLRRYHAYNETRTAVRALLGTASTIDVGHELSDLADRVLRSTAGSLGLPDQGLGIFGLGRLGGREMGFGSDLDLILLYDERTCDRSSAEATARALAQAMTAIPPLYKVDFRLRPEGRNAPLAVERGYLATYLAERADPWELMAMTRLRLVWGDRAFGRAVSRLVRAALTNRGPVTTAYLLKMRRAMEKQRVRSGDLDLKVSAGGIVDVEFVAQSLALRHHALLGRSTAEMLALAVRRRWIAAQHGRPLLDGLTELRRLESLIRLGTPTATSVLPQDDLTRSALAAGIGSTTAPQLMKRVRIMMKSARAAFRASVAAQGRRS